MTLNKEIESLEDQLRPFFGITEERWSNLTARLRKHIADPKDDYYDEVVWTFLLCVAFASGGDTGVVQLYRALTEDFGQISAREAIRPEALPIPPREREGNTNVDLAMGSISSRSDQLGGIEYDPDPAKGSSVVFCEMKWYSDISSKVTHDQTRNQLSRVIENAMTFQKAGKFPAKVSVVLVTPQLFVDQAIKSRLYQYKLEEYQRSPETLLDEWRASHHLLPPRNKGNSRKNFPDWVYPDEEDLRDRLNNGFNLEHLSFEELFDRAPDTSLTRSIMEFAVTHNQATKRFGRPALT
ncbi:MAG: hypothetical protein CMO55_07980 [Verrucomicrobiales bacterium]|nr:hypothetical protein [Verrucomicrobiales bacterium]